MVDPLTQQAPSMPPPMPMPPMDASGTPVDPDGGVPGPEQGFIDPAPLDAAAEPLTAPPAPPGAPVDPALAAIDTILDIPGPEAIRRVYQLATSAARAKVKLDAMADRLDARQYHAHLSANPEAKVADVLIAARRRLDTLAQERRRLNLETLKAQEAGRPFAVYELQSAAATSAMEQVAGGVLLFLALPVTALQGLTQPTPEPVAAEAMEPSTEVME